MLKQRMWLRPEAYKMGMGCFCQVNTCKKKVYLYLDAFRNTDSTTGSSRQAAASVSGCRGSERAAPCRKSRSMSQQRAGWLARSLGSEQSLAAHIHHRSASSCLFFLSSFTLTNPQLWTAGKRFSLACNFRPTTKETVFSVMHILVIRTWIYQDWVQVLRSMFSVRI